MPVQLQCLCCKKSQTGKNGHYCDNCWDYLMPERGQEGIGWDNIWTMIAHWHATHDESDKNYEFVDQIITGCYVYEGRT